MSSLRTCLVTTCLLAPLSGCAGLVHGNESTDAGQEAGKHDASVDVERDEACVSGASCAPENKCHLGTMNCAIRACVDMGRPDPSSDGVPCGDGQTCEKGVCIACTQGAACTPAEACHTGTLDCSTGAPVCMASGTTGKDEAPCGGGTYCCAGTCTDEQKDAMNCGRCGHSCQGGTCVDAMCQPVTLAAVILPPWLGGAPAEPQGIAVDSVSVYWTSADGSVWKVPISGGSVTTLVMGAGAPAASAQGIAIDSSAVYWSDPTNGNVLKVPLSGGAPTTLASGQDNPGGPAVDGTSVYWVNTATASFPTLPAGAVLKVALGGGAPTTLASGTNFLPAPWSIGLSSTNVYWIGAVKSDMALLTVPISGGVPTTLGTDQFDWPIVLDATSVYSRDGQSVVRFPLAGGDPQTLVAGQTEQVLGVAVDSARLYWGDGRDNGAIRSTPLGGGAITTLATGQAFPAFIALDANCVYWANEGGYSGPPPAPGSILKVAKP